MADSVCSPAHYAGDGEVECMDALASMMAPVEERGMAGGGAMSPACSYWWGCVFKYVWRWPLKNDVEDLRKARQCLGYLIAERSTEIAIERDLADERVYREHVPAEFADVARPPAGDVPGTCDGGRGARPSDGGETPGGRVFGRSCEGASALEKAMQGKGGGL